MSEWISVKDRLPEKGKLVLIWTGNDDRRPAIFLAYLDDDGQEWVDGDYYTGAEYVTYWQPLPEPPQEPDA